MAKKRGGTKQKATTKHHGGGGKRGKNTSSGGGSFLGLQSPLFLGVLLGIAGLALKDYGTDLLVALGLQDASAKSGKRRTPVNPVDACGLVMADSSFPNGGWGMFTLRDLPHGSPVGYPSLLIHIPDIPTEHADAVDYILHDYLWGGDIFGGGMGEGRTLYSFLPGVGSLANGHPSQWNVAPVRWPAEMDDPPIHRATGSPGTGAGTHYHGLSFHVYGERETIPAGDEIVVNYGLGWLHKVSDTEETNPRKAVRALRENGLCLDHIESGISKIQDAGRGAFAKRRLPKGTMVAPLPLIPIRTRESMEMDDDRQQLLKNYCFTHTNSTLLLLPYGPTVNLVNHGGKGEANVRLRWSESTLWDRDQKLQLSVLEVAENPHGLLMELVATREIRRGEEILLDYGEDWESAWAQHKSHWEPPANAANHVYFLEFDKSTPLLRTPEELNENPYPSNLQTTCYYSYNPEQRTPIIWEHQRETLQPNNLFPCHVLERNSTSNEYTIHILPSTSPFSQTEIPENHVVERVPRGAVRFQDAHLSTDQQLKGTFRHSMGIPSDLFPTNWMNIV